MLSYRINFKVYHTSAKQATSPKCLKRVNSFYLLNDVSLFKILNTYDLKVRRNFGQEYIFLLYFFGSLKPKSETRPVFIMIQI